MPSDNNQRQKSNQIVVNPEIASAVSKSSQRKKSRSSSKKKAPPPEKNEEMLEEGEVSPVKGGVICDLQSRQGGLNYGRSLADYIKID